MPINVPDIRNIFDKYNALCFEGKLPVPRIKIGHSKNYLGQLRVKFDKNADGSITYSDYSLVFSQLYEIDEEKLVDVVIHEMIHYYILLNHIKDTSAHAVVFRKIMNAINTRFNRHIAISDRSRMPVDGENQQTKVFLVCVASLKSGDTAVAVCARTRAFEIKEELPRRYEILKLNWYITTDPYFNRFKRCITAKLYYANKEELTKHLASATEMKWMTNVSGGRGI